jgi:Ohr subfamily peroxiredoxin
MAQELGKEPAIQAPGRVIYTAKVHAVGGRESGAVRSLDGRLDAKLALPGSTRIGTNPEQLFAAGWAASFESAVLVAARTRNVALLELAVDAEVDLHLADGAYFLSARLNISLPGLDRGIVRELVEDADRLCPYSKATRGNIRMAINLV